MKRREFIFAWGASSALAAAGARAQAVHRIGWLATGSPESGSQFREAFFDGMRRHGYEQGRNLLVESRYAQGQLDRLPALARELAALKPALIVSGAHQSTVALKQATSSVPIVFRLGIDPVETGLVASLGRPGGNLTGIFQLTADLFGKRFELLREFAPRARRLGMLHQSSEEPFAPMMREFARKAGFELVSLIADQREEIEPALATAVPQRLEAIMVGGGPINNLNRQLVVDAVNRTRLPAVYPELYFVELGGLAAYASDLRAGFGQLADYARRILAGAKPADLPVEQSTRFALVVNLKTARASGIAVPQAVLLRTDNVIE